MVGAGSKLRKIRDNPTLMPQSSSHRITGLLRAWGQGDDAALAALTPLVYAELRRRASVYMSRERRGHTLQPSALVKECYLRLVNTRQVEWQDRNHFFALAARLMRRILVDIARGRQYGKRRAGSPHVAVDEQLPVAAPGHDIVALDDALHALATIDERKARVVEMRFFGGLSNADVAESLGVSAKTVIREWQLARAWLLRELTNQ
jgi:RNA polymerase sigma-70 factor (ECF subfamily)